MGTRGLIYIHDSEAEVIACIWSKYDSYPNVLGKEVIADFCTTKPLVTMMGVTEKAFLGMGDFALQFCSYLVSYRRPRIGGNMGELPDMMKPKRWTSPSTGNFSLIDPMAAPQTEWIYHIYPDYENNSFLIEIEWTWIDISERGNWDEEEKGMPFPNGIFSITEVLERF
jgi:hypothetical protein